MSNLRGSDRDSIDSDLIYLITKQPKYGKISKLTPQASQSIDKFTQRDLDELLIIYQLHDLQTEDYEDSFMFDLVDLGGNSLPNQILKIKWSFISFSSAIYYVDEEKDDYLTIDLKRRGDLTETAFATISVLNGTAIIGKDVSSKMAKQVQFNAGQNRASWSLKLLKDDLYERNETLQLELSEGIHTILDEQIRTNVIILDEADKARMSFVDREYIVDESIGQVVLKIKRTGDINKNSVVT